MNFLDDIMAQINNISTDEYISNENKILEFHLNNTQSSKLEGHLIGTQKSDLAVLQLKNGSIAFIPLQSVSHIICKKQ